MYFQRMLKEKTMNTIMINLQMVKVCHTLQVIILNLAV